MSTNQNSDSIYKINKQWLSQSFGEAASSYDEVAVLQREIADRLFARLEYIQLKPDSILDLGSGTGYCSKLLDGKFNKANVYALDISHQMLTYARAQRGFFQRLRNPQYYLCGDAERLPIQDDAVDMVFSSLALQWCFDLDKTFSDLRRVIKPGGLLMFATLGPDTLKELRSSWRAVDDKSHVSAFIDMHDIGDALMRAGFSGPVMDVENITLTYSSVNNLMKDLKKLGSRNALQGRPGGLMGKNKMKQMISNYEKYRTEEGVLPATYEVVYGHAWVPEEGARPSVTGTAMPNDFPIPVRVK